MWRFYEKNNPIERERIDGFSFYSDEYIIIISSLFPLVDRLSSLTQYIIIYLFAGRNKYHIGTWYLRIQDNSPGMLTPIIPLTTNF